jgi:serine/threonine-protein kinase
VAVAPFNPLRPEYALWQEGIVDVLARALDGAGPVRTVAPAVAIRGWNGRKADRASARALAVRTGARYAVFGSVTSAPGGAVQLRGALLDARTDSLWEQAWVGLDVKPLADSATTFVLGRLGERHPIGAVRRVAFASTSPEALKPFLQGEQLFRRTAWGPARQAYARAAALDTAFALPLRRIGQIIGYEHDNADSVGRAYALRAGALNRGLGARDSLLVSIDSLFAALSQREGTSTDWAGLQRLFATANLTARRYPDDPEVWFTLGEVREHLGYGSVADVSDEDVFAAFERAIALDPGFAPAYIHAVGLAFKLRGRTTGRTYNSAYLSLTPVGGAAEAAFVVERVTDPARAASPETRRVLDSVPTSVLRNALLTLRRWPDSAETALTLVRAIARRPATAASHPTDSAMVQSYLPLTLAYRGRFNEAFEALGSRRSRLFSELVLLGGVPRDTAEAVFARWLADGSPHARFALPYWAEHGNVSALHRFRARADTALRAAKPTTYAGLTHDVRAADAYLALAQRDTGRAVTAFAQLSDTLCLGCYLDRLTYARLLRTRGRLEEADRLLRQRLYTVLTPSEVWISAERARVAQQRRDRATARSAYEFVSEAWSRGDPEVQPVLREAREALRNLGTRNDSIVAAATRPE